MKLKEIKKSVKTAEVLIPLGMLGVGVGMEILLMSRSLQALKKLNKALDIYIAEHSVEKPKKARRARIKKSPAEAQTCAE